MDIGAIEGQEMTSVEFAAEFLRLRFADHASGPLFTFHVSPHLLFAEFSLAFGEPEYRNGLCSLIGETVAKASCEEGEALTIEFETGTVIALSLREEDVDGPQSGSYSEDGSSQNDVDF